MAFIALAPVASAQDIEWVGRELESIEGQVASLIEEPLTVSARRSPTYVEERLADGELFFRLRDYLRASVLFTDIVDNHRGHPAYPEALFLLGESLFQAGDFLGARTRFREIVEQSGNRAYQPFAQRALGRAIEVAIRTQNFEGVEELFSRLSQLPPTEIEAGTNYFRAKYLFGRAVPHTDAVTPGQLTPETVNLSVLEESRAAFDLVASASPYYGQARYFIGVIHTIREEYPQALAEFGRVLRSAESAESTTGAQGSAEADSEETVSSSEAQVSADLLDLTYLALGRLYYETEQLEQAIEAYQAVPRTSQFFDAALYEIAWVYIRLGDATRAERALEVLSVASPDSPYIPDGKLLRGNLLLRNGRYEDALVVFRELGQEFGPVRRDLDEMLRDHDADPAGYFRQLVRENMDSFDVNAFLPPSAQRWSSFEGEMGRALTVLEDLSQCRRLVQETSELIQRLSAAISQPNLVGVFPDLRRQRETSTSLRNRMTRVRRALAALEVSGGGGSAELQSVRARRRELERFVADLPTEESDFDSIDAVQLEEVRELERELVRLEVDLTGMEARITATTQFLASTTRSQETAGDGAADDGVRAELALHQSSLEEYRAQVRELRILLEAARLQIGVGDDRYRRQAEMRTEYEQLTERERALGGTNPEFDRLYDRMRRLTRQLDERDARIDEAVQERASDIRRQVEEEAVHVQEYTSTLASLESETEEVVGGLSFENFQRVQHRFYDLVLRSDVGEIDVAWAQREEHRMRVEMLTRDRERELRVLDDEFREINDESPAGSGSSASTSSETTSAEAGQ